MERGAIKVHFHLTQDEDGYPSVSVESVWAQPGSNERECVIDNVPFFAKVATLGDTVLTREEDGVRWFDSVIRRSGNSLIRVTFFDKGCVDSVIARLAEIGCSSEYLGVHNLLAVNIPETVELADAIDYLRSEASAGHIDYEEPILRQ